MPDLLDDVLRFPAALPPSDVGDNAVAAEVVAPEHDIDPGFKGVLPLCGQILHNKAGVLPDVHSHLPYNKPFPHKLCQLKDVVGAKNNVHKPIALFYLLHHLGFLHHAAAQGDEHVGILLFQRVQIAQVTVYPLVGIFPDCAGVIEDKIRMLVLCLQKANPAQDPHKFFRVAGVHLAAEGLSKKAWATSVFPFKLPDPLPAFCHEVVLSGRFFCGRLCIHIYFI